MRRPVIVIGDVSRDIVITEAIATVSGNVVRGQQVSKTEKAGQAATLAGYLQQLGVSVWLLGVVGDDAAGASLSQLAQSVCDKAALPAKGETYERIVINTGGQPSRITQPPDSPETKAANAEILTSYIDMAAEQKPPEGFGCVILASYGRETMYHSVILAATKLAADCQTPLLYLCERGYAQSVPSSTTLILSQEAAELQIAASTHPAAAFSTEDRLSWASDVRSRLQVSSVLSLYHGGVVYVDGVTAEGRTVSSTAAASDGAVEAAVAAVAVGMMDQVSLEEALDSVAAAVRISHAGGLFTEASVRSGRVVGLTDLLRILRGERTANVHTRVVLVNFTTAEHGRIVEAAVHLREPGAVVVAVASTNQAPLVVNLRSVDYVLVTDSTAAGVVQSVKPDVLLTLDAPALTEGADVAARHGARVEQLPGP